MAIARNLNLFFAYNEPVETIYNLAIRLITSIQLIYEIHTRKKL
jgi:hypothetical protein